MLEMMPDTVIFTTDHYNRKWHVAYQIEAISVTLSHFQGHSWLKWSVWPQVRAF